jgi:hypothetical protein
MNKLSKIQSWINRDDGKFYKIGNENLNVFEIFGYLLLIAALITKLLHDKAGLDATWIGWVCLIMGAILAFYGAMKKQRENKNT